MKKNKKIIVIIAGIIVVIIATYLLFNKEAKTSIVIKTTQIAIGNITTSVTATGTIQPVDQVEVGTQVSGLVKRIFVDFNAPVKKGQLLAELDKTILQESVSNANASYVAAQNEVNYYQQAYERANKMYSEQVISKADYEQAIYQLNNAKATVTQRKIALSQAQTNLGYANIYSPIDGIILSKEVDEGQTVAASMSTPTLFSIAKDITKMQVEANVDEADIGNVQVGQRVTFTVDAFPNETFNGFVNQVRLGATTTSNVVTYTVIITADNPEQKLKPGLTATVTIFTKELNNVASLEAAAFTFNPDITLLQQYYKQSNNHATLPDIQKSNVTTKYVWVQNQDGTINQQQVNIGTSDGIQVEIISGLTAQDHIVIGMEENIGTKNKETSGTSSSPFMPKRPGSNNKKSSERQQPPQ